MKFDIALDPQTGDAGALGAPAIRIIAASLARLTDEFLFQAAESTFPSRLCTFLANDLRRSVHKAASDFPDAALFAREPVTVEYRAPRGFTGYEPWRLSVSLGATTIRYIVTPSR